MTPKMGLRLLVSCLTLISLTEADSIVDGTVDDMFLAQKDVHLILEQARKKREAEEPAVAALPKTPYPYDYKFKDADDKTLARLRTEGPLMMKLLQVKEGKPAVVGSISLNSTATTTASKDASGAVLATMNFKGLPAGSDPNLTVEEVTIKLTLSTGTPKKDYWSLSSITTTVTATLHTGGAGETNQNITMDLDLTPKRGYTSNIADAACTNGYGICAPTWLSWSCSSQILSPLTFTELAPSGYSARLVLSGLQLQPGEGDSFAINWDCDPLIPISLWVSLLISLMLISILTYGIAMISSIHTPDKYDDPKGPTISVGQTE